MSNEEQPPKLRRDVLRTLASMAFLAAGVDKVMDRAQASTNSTQCGKVLAVPPAEAMRESMDSYCGISSPEGGPVTEDEECGTVSIEYGTTSDNDCNKLASKSGDKHEDGDCGGHGGVVYAPRPDSDCTTTGEDNQCGMSGLSMSFEDDDCLGSGSDSNCGVGGGLGGSTHGAQDVACTSTISDEDCGVMNSSGMAHTDSSCSTTDNACGMVTNPVAVQTDSDCGTNPISSDKDCRRTYHGDQDCQYSGNDQTCTQGKDTLSPPIDPDGPNPPVPPW